MISQPASLVLNGMSLSLVL